MDEELLISLVEKYPELYNHDDPKYHDDQRRMTAWEEISGFMDDTPIACRQKWKKIRENFRKANLLRKMKSEQGVKYSKPIRFAKQLYFVMPFIQNDSTDPLENLTKSDDEEERSPIKRSPDPVRRVKKKIKTEEGTPRLEKKSLVAQEDEDTTVNFFKNLGETVRDFPPELRVRVKRDVFNIVSEAEEECIERNYDPA